MRRRRPGRKTKAKVSADGERAGAANKVLVGQTVTFPTFANLSVVDGRLLMHGADEMWSNVSPWFSWRTPKTPWQLNNFKMR